MNFELSKLSSQEIETISGPSAVAVLPVGSIEQHGPHLPEEVDSRIVTAISRRATEKASREIDVLVTPTLRFGCSNHHMDFSGTLSLNQNTFIKVIKELCFDLVQHGFKRLVLVNGHGGNATPLKLAVDQIRDATEGDVLAATFSYWQLIEDEVSQIRDSGPGGISHGGEFETSVMLHLDEQLVKKDKIKKFMPEWTTNHLGTGWYLPQKVHLGWHISDISETGLFGDPTLANKDKGEKFLNVAVDKISQFLIDFSGWEFQNLTVEGEEQ